ncbi:cell wall mannoprotein 1 family protein [Aspergillus stella-maris]|uniref:cell wall mannoprotein 1 family protein n=1 Tax=Aspergillus stella-maris TaxID=1810926 RepID=UPI003CCDD315
MKLASTLTGFSLALATSVSATTHGATHAHTARDLDTIKGVLSDIDTQVTSLNDAITAKPLDTSSIISQSNKLSTTITSGTDTVNSQDVLENLDALALVSPTQKLADNTDEAVQSLVDVKAEVIKLGKGCKSLQQLEKLHDGATALAGAIVAKVPEGLGGIAKDLSDKISAAIQKGVDAYQGSCTKSDSSSASDSGSGTSKDFPTPKMPVPVNVTPRPKPAGSCAA